VKNYFSSNFKLGILGGGQLGKMILSETQKLDIYTLVLDPSKEAPCKDICNTFMIGDLLDFDTVYNFGKQVDVLTIEIENVNIDALDKLEAAGITVYPKPQNLRVIQSKATQKLHYTNHQIPTAPFHTFTTKKALEHGYLNNQIQLPFVW
jgi:5-(carboxyamino)imidazole ribonucleotide synthase